MTQEEKKRMKGGRKILLAFLESKGCSAYVNEVLSELEKFFGNRRGGSPVPLRHGQGRARQG
jgi:hypothetical protein